MYNIGNMVNNILINVCGCCSVVQLCPILLTPCTAAYEASLSFTSLLQWSLLRLMPVESTIRSYHLIFCCPLLLPPLIIPCIRVFSIELALFIRWPKYWSFSISPSNEYSGLIPLGLTDMISLQSKGYSSIFNTTVQKHQFFDTQPLLWSNSHPYMTTRKVIYMVISGNLGCPGGSDSKGSVCNLGDPGSILGL